MPKEQEEMEIRVDMWGVVVGVWPGKRGGNKKKGEGEGGGVGWTCEMIAEEEEKSTVEWWGWWLGVWGVGCSVLSGGLGMLARRV